MKVQIIKILVCCRSSAYGEFIALNSCIITEQRSNISKLSFHRRNQKEEQLKPKQAEKINNRHWSRNLKKMERGSK